VNKYSYIISDMVWSFSRLTAFEDCPYRWLNQYIFEEDKKDQFFSGYGSFIHNILAMYFGGDLTRDELLTYYLLNYSKAVIGKAPNPNIFASYFSQGVNYFKYSNIFDYPEPYKVIGVEKEFNFMVGGHPFKGFSDLLLEDAEGLVIVDHKSRVIRPPSKRKKATAYDTEREYKLMQLYIYAAAMKYEFHEYPKKLVFNCFRTPELIIEKFDEQKLNSTERWVNDTISNISSTEIWTPEMEFFKCKYICDLVDCPYRNYV